MSLLQINSTEVVITTYPDDITKKRHSCPYNDCRWSFDTTYSLERHIKSHTKDKPFKCTQCPKTFANKYNVTEHENSHKDIPCSVEGCKEIFQKKRELNSHFKDVHISKVFHCPRKRCNYSFHSGNELAEHLANHNFLHKCEICSKRFRKMSLLKLHLSVHESKELSYKCSYENCGKTFGNEQRLKRHELIHENKRSFVCPVEGCGKSFNCFEYLRHHKRTHEPDNKIRCIYPDCDKYFATPSTLRVHLQLHAECRPFKCDVKGCKKAYLTASNLKAHLALHKTPKYKAKEKILIKNLSFCNDESASKDLFDNASFFEICTLSEDLLSEGAVAASVGELAINQYVNQQPNTQKQKGKSEPKKRRRRKKRPPSTPQSQNTKTQDDLVSNVYSMLDTNILSGHDYEQAGNIIKNINPEEFELTYEQGADSERTYKDLCMTYDFMGASSMELSTGHLVIDGSEFGSALTCVPDHVYTNNKSTVNLDDIR